VGVYDCVQLFGGGFVGVGVVEGWIEWIGMLILFARGCHLLSSWFLHGCFTRRKRAVSERFEYKLRGNREVRGKSKTLRLMQGSTLRTVRLPGTTKSGCRASRFPC
jgi:hypothetical protein